MKLILLIVFIVLAVFWGGYSGYDLVKHEYQKAIFDILMEIINIGAFTLLLFII